MNLRSKSIVLSISLFLLSVSASYFVYRSHAQQPNRPPVAVPDSVTVHGSQITPTGANALTNDSDPDGDNLTVSYTPFTQTSLGQGNVGWNGNIQFLAGPNAGTVDIPYTIYDGRGGQASSYVTFNVVNSPPVAMWDLVVLPGLNNYTDKLNLLDNDSDPDGDTIQANYQANTNLPGGVGIYSIVNNVISVSRYAQFSGTYVIFYQVADSLGATSAGAIVLVLLPMDLANNAGAFCPSPGKPVNPTNGNMWIDQPADYVLPGVGGDGIVVDRFYNSVIQTSGLFGQGWSTQYDESITTYGDKLLRVDMPDGRAVYFVRQNTTDPFVAYQSDVQGHVVQNTDGTFALTFKDGRIHEFNSAGRLTKLIDRNGNPTTLAYSVYGDLASVTDPFGRSLSLTPNGNGQVASISNTHGTVATYEYFPGTTLLKTVTYPDGSKYKFEYDTTTASGKVLLKTVKDAYDNILEEHLYDSTGRATTSEVHGGVEKYEFDYTNANGSDPYTIVKHKKNANDPYITTKYYFNNVRGRNYVTRAEGVCGCGGNGSEITEFQYDRDLRLKKKIDAEGRSTDYTYDANRNVIQVTDALGTQKWTYNSRGQILTYQDRADQSTSNSTVANTYDASGNLLTTTDALGNTTTLTYTTAGQPATVTDARNKTTAFTYDPQSRLIAVRDANNKDTLFAYDARSRLTGTTNPKSEITSFEYDLNDRLKKVIYPDGNYVEHTYDLAGRRTATRDPRGNSTTYGYDSAYRLTSVTDELSHTRTFSYDLMSNLILQTDALGNTTNFEYDDFNRLKKLIYPAATAGATRLEESMTYDKVGNVKTRVDTAGRTTSYDYDTSNRLTKITDAMINQTNFEYNLRSQLTKVKDALNQEYVFTYDALGRTLSQTRAGTTRSYLYDPVGNRTKRTDYNGRVTNYEYDNLNRLTKTTYAAGSTPSPMDSISTYTYDDLSRLLTATNNVGTVTLTYDNRGRLKTETDVWGKVIEYGYDGAGNRTSLKLDGASYATYAYDDADRLTGIANVGDSTTTTYGYDSADRLTSRILPNGITTTYEYDGMSRLKRLKDENGAGAIYDRQYTYNASNQISQIADLAQSRNFTYDNLDRLTGMTDGMSAETYAFDAVGNRTSSHLSSTYTYEPFNRMRTTQTSSQFFDANGNTISKSEGTKIWNYYYDFESRMTRAADRRVNVTYKYDALGRRVERNRQYGIERTKFTHDGDDVLVEDANGTAVKYQNGPGIDNKLSIKQGTTTNYFLADHLGSTNALTDSSGAITASQTYDSFGNGSNGAFPSRYQFTGREYDSTIGLQFSRARFYDAKLGRFISEDPIGFEGGDINIYGYVNNRPIVLRDPSGKHGTMGAATAATFLLLASASPVNAPSRCDPVYFPDNPLLANAMMGQALGMAGGYLYGRFISPYVGRLMAGMGDDITTLGISGGPKTGTINNPVVNTPRLGRGAADDPVYPRYDAKGRITQEFPATPKAHGFSDMVDNYAHLGQRTVLEDGAELIQLLGSNNGVSGRFEWIIDRGFVTHRMFVQGGTLNGVVRKP